jgi:flagellar basal body rod protein FlgG
LKDAQTKLNKLENEFKAINKLLIETQNKLSNVDVSSHIFNVVRVGRLYESNTDVLKQICLIFF